MDHLHRGLLLPGAAAHVGDDRAEERVHATGAKERMGARSVGSLYKWVSKVLDPIESDDGVPGIGAMTSRSSSQVAAYI